jgi:glycosyltransferase involved in cell wall biosynthesis
MKADPDAPVRVLCDLTYTGDPVGHGGHHRSGQMRELVAATGAEFAVIPVEFRQLNLKSYLLGLGFWLRHGIRAGLGWRWLRRWGRHCGRYRQALARFPGANVLIWENSRPGDWVAPFLAHEAGLSVLAAPQNIETLGQGRRIRRPRQFPARQMFAEMAAVGKADRVYCISREEQWFSAWYGVSAAFLPYHPPKSVLAHLLAVREQRQPTRRDHRFLILGTATNPPTGQGMTILLKQLRQITELGAFEVDVVGAGTDRLKAELDHPRFTFHGRVGADEIHSLLVATKAVLIHQPLAVGALTRIPEMLAAGIPVIGNPIACRSATGLPGVYVYQDISDLAPLLRAQLPPPPLPEEPPQAGEFVRCVRGLAGRNPVAGLIGSTGFMDSDSDPPPTASGSVHAPGEAR